MLKQTPLYEYHAAYAKKVGEFAGYDMPFYYGEGVIAEHLWVREEVGLFDVSHMGQIEIIGDGARNFLEKITPSSFEKTPINAAKYTVMTNNEGGIVDDLIVIKLSEDHFFAVINAGCKEKDIAWIKQHLPQDLELRIFDDRALVALQGPLAEQVLSHCLGQDLSALKYMRMEKYNDIWVSRLGYTGEDGFEISLPAADALPFWNKLASEGSVKPVGLAARDSLRLEMGYPLYGHDINDHTTPYEADLKWIMRKSDKGFIGGDVLSGDNISRTRVGIELIDKGVAREGAKIVLEDGKEIGDVTSGGHSPCLKKSIAMGYVECSYAEVGTELYIDVRGRKIRAVIKALPFIQAKTKTQKKGKVA